MVIIKYIILESIYYDYVTYIIPPTTALEAITPPTTTRLNKDNLYFD